MRAIEHLTGGRQANGFILSVCREPNELAEHGFSMLRGQLAPWQRFAVDRQDFQTCLWRILPFSCYVLFSGDRRQSQSIAPSARSTPA